MLTDPNLLKRRFTNITASWFSGPDDEQTSAYNEKRLIKGDEFPVASLPARVVRDLRVIRVYYRDKTVECIVDDVGPWNVRDRYWESEEGRPAAERQHRERDEAQNGRIPRNAAGLDLSPEAWRELGADIDKGLIVVDWEFVTDPVVMKKTWDKYMALYEDLD